MPTLLTVSEPLRRLSEKGPRSASQKCSIYLRKKFSVRKRRQQSAARSFKGTVFYHKNMTTALQFLSFLHFIYA